MCIDRCKDLYLDLLKRSLIGQIYEDASTWIEGIGQQAQRAEHIAPIRAIGADWPAAAPTMIGLARLDNLQHCVESVIEDRVPGDLIETGVWRGGAVIFMRGVLKAHGVTDRRVWAADSFQGLPPPRDDLYPADAGDRNYVFDELAVTLETVRGNFERYGLLDDQVQFVK